MQLHEEPTWTLPWQQLKGWQNSGPKKTITLNEPQWSEARVAAAKSASVLPSEIIPISECIDRTLACDVISLVDLPTYKTSAMDGYAVAGKGPWKIVGDGRAGTPMNQALVDKTAVRIDRKSTRLN